MLNRLFYLGVPISVGVPRPSFPLPALAPLPPPSCGNEEVEEEECGLLCDKFHFSVFGVGLLNTGKQRLLIVIAHAIQGLLRFR